MSKLENIKDKLEYAKKSKLVSSDSQIMKDIQWLVDRIEQLESAPSQCLCDMKVEKR